MINPGDTKVRQFFFGQDLMQGQSHAVGGRSVYRPVAIVDLPDSKGP